MALADALDALTPARPYKDAYPFDDVVTRLGTEAGTAFDPAVVAALDRARDGVRIALAPEAG